MSPRRTLEVAMEENREKKRIFVKRQHLRHAREVILRREGRENGGSSQNTYVTG